MESLKSENRDAAVAASINGASNTIPFLSSVEPDILASLENKRVYDAFKRIADFILALGALIVLSPFMLVIAAVIALDDMASPFYVSTRCGRDGREFRFIKFRSMRKNADQELEALLDKNEADGPVFKIENDPRITRVGKFLRRTSLDELPQLFNVIKGDMSLVGPRPPIPREVEQYNAYQMYRLAVRPGLTCFWQVQPKRNSLSFDNWVELDIKYILERSITVDISLIFRTFGVMVKSEGQ